MPFQVVEELDMLIWKDLREIVVINVDGDSLKTLQLWFRVR